MHRKAQRALALGLTHYGLLTQIELERTLSRDWDIDPFNEQAREIALDVLHAAAWPDTTTRPDRPCASRAADLRWRTNLQSAKHVAGSQDQKADQQEREPGVSIRDAEMSVVNNCSDQGNNDGHTESDNLGC